MSISPVKHILGGCNDKQLSQARFLQSIGLLRCGDSNNDGSVKKSFVWLPSPFELNNKTRKQPIRLNIDDSLLLGCKWLNALSPRVLLKSPVKEHVDGFQTLNFNSWLDSSAKKALLLQKENVIMLNSVDNDSIGELENPANQSSTVSIDLCSELGQRLYRKGHKRKRWRCSTRNRTAGRELSNWYDKYCNRFVFEPVSDLQITTRRSAAAEYTMAFDGGRRTTESLHEYHYTRLQRQEFCRRVDTGLDAHSRRLKRQMKSCEVKLQRISSRIISYWARSRCQQSVSVKPCGFTTKPCFISLCSSPHYLQHECHCVSVEQSQPETDRLAYSLVHSVRKISVKPCSILIPRLPSVKRCSLPLCNLSPDDIASIEDHSLCCKCCLCDCSYRSAKRKHFKLESNVLLSCDGVSESAASCSCSSTSTLQSEPSTSVSCNSSLCDISFQRIQELQLVDRSSKMLNHLIPFPGATQADISIDSGLNSCCVKLKKCDNQSPSQEFPRNFINAPRISDSCSIRLKKLPLKLVTCSELTVESNAFTRKFMSSGVASSQLNNVMNNRFSPILRLKPRSLAACSTGIPSRNSLSIDKNEEIFDNLPLTPVSCFD